MTHIQGQGKTQPGLVLLCTELSRCKIPVFEVQSAIPQNVSVFADRPFNGVIKAKHGYCGGSLANMNGILSSREATGHGYVQGNHVRTWEEDNTNKPGRGPQANSLSTTLCGLSLQISVASSLPSPFFLFCFPSLPILPLFVHYCYKEE